MMTYTPNAFNNMIQYEDKDLLVVFKPAGLAVESRRISQQDLEGLARLWRVGKGEKAEIYPVQRLDQPVEGLMALAKTRKAASVLSREIQVGQLKKTYRAQVAGTIPSRDGELVNTLITDKKTNKTLVLDPVPGKGIGHRTGEKRAVLNYRQIADNEVEIDLKTGRHHQIRAQLAHAGMPIVGDVKYSGPSAEQLCLCSCRLSLIHPSTRQRMNWSVVPTWEQR